MQRAKLMLAARGVRCTRKALAGATLEAERDALMVAFFKALANIRPR